MPITIFLNFREIFFAYNNNKMSRQKAGWEKIYDTDEEDEEETTRATEVKMQATPAVRSTGDDRQQAGAAAAAGDTVAHRIVQKCVELLKQWVLSDPQGYQAFLQGFLQALTDGKKITEAKLKNLKTGLLHMKPSANPARQKGS